MRPLFTTILQVLYRTLVAVCLIALACIPAGLAQEPGYVHYGVNEGLPSSEVYQIIEDQQGYLWMATDKGISRFDGREFQSYSVQDGLTDNVVFWLYADAKNRLWFVCRNGDLSYLEQDSVHKVVHLPHDPRFGAVFVVQGDTAYLAVNDAAFEPHYLKISSSGEMERVPVPIGTDRPAVVPIKINGREQLDVFVPRQHANQRNLHVEGEHAGIIPLEQGGRLNENHIRLLPGKEATRLAVKNKLLQFKSGEVQLQGSFKHDQTNFLYQSSDGILWAGAHHVGVARIDPDRPGEFTYWLDGYSVSQMIEDREGGLWFCTLENGLMYAPAASVRAYPIGAIDFIQPVGIQTVVGYQHQMLTSFVDGQLEESHLQISGRFKDLIQTSNGLFLSGLQLASAYELPSGLQLNVVPYYGALGAGSGQRFWVGGSQGTFAVDAATKEMIRDPIQGGKVGCLLEYQGVLYLGTAAGLLLRKHGEQALRAALLPEEQQITALAIDSNVVFAAGKGYGISVLDLQGNLKQVLREEDGLSSRFVNKMRLQEDTLWVGTNRGLVAIVKPLDDEQRRAYRLTHRDGLLSDEVTDIQEHEQNLLIGTSKGMNVLPKQLLFAQATAPILYLAPKKELTQDSVLQQAYSSEGIRLDFFGIAYRHGQSIQYAYRLLGQSDEWRMTSDQQVTFKELDPGEYQFELQAVVPNARSEIIRLPVVVKPLYWQTWWFPLAIALLALLLVFLVFRSRELRIKQQAVAENTQLRLTYKALSAQMNPHFIFNALSSIQRLVMDQLTDEAITYLAGFGRLMRQVLHQSDRLFVPLDREMELINTYVKLEKLRFEREFDFQWDLDLPLRNGAYAVPTMLLQPMVENAIHHGILPMKSTGIISIHISQLDHQLLKLEIADNGQGLAAASRQGSAAREHPAKGIDLLEKRLAVFQKLYQADAQVEVANASTASFESGTCIRLQVPFQSIAL